MEMTISQQIKTIRQSMKLSQAGLAESAGLSRQQIADWELNRGRPLAEDYLKIIAVFLDSIWRNKKKKAA